MCMPALALVGGIVSAVGSLAVGQANANAANAQAAMYERQAQAERAQAQFNSERQREKGIKMLATQRAGFLGNGVALSGSALDVLLDTTRENELDVSAIKYNAEIKAQNFEMQADSYKAKASAARMAGLFGAISPIIRGAGGADFAGSSFGGTSLEDES